MKWPLSIITFLLVQFFTSGLVLAASYPVTITDSDGKNITISKPFTRIISLYPAHTTNLLELGARNSLVAVSRSDKEMDRLPRVSFRDDPERLLSLKPDLVLIRPMISRAYPHLVRRLEASGVTVISLQPVSVDQLYDYWSTLGVICGRQEEARDLVARFRKGLERMAQKVAAIPINRRPRVYFEAIHRRMKTFAPTSMAIFVLENAGGVNVAADAIRLRNTNIAEYGKEKILSKANEIDVFLAQKGRMNPVTIEDIVNEPGFQIIKAVREGRIYLVDERVVSRPTPRLLEGMEIIYGLLFQGGKGGKR